MAGKVDNKEIIVGAASIYLGASSTSGEASSRPNFATGSSYRDTLDSDADWRNVGYTMEGLEISYEPDFADVEVDQILDSALIFKQSQKVSVNTTFAQATLLNLMIAWGQNENTFSSTATEATLDMDGGALGDAPVERGLIAVGNGVHGRGDAASYSERVYHAYRVLQVEQSTYGMKRNEASGVPVSFRALPANSGKYGVMKDRKKTW